MVRERSEAGIQSFAANLVSQWESARENHLDSPDIDALLQMLRENGYYVPLNAATLNYLQNCERERCLPDPKMVRRSLRQ